MAEGFDHIHRTNLIGMGMLQRFAQYFLAQNIEKISLWRRRDKRY